MDPLRKADVWGDFTNGVHTEDIQGAIGLDECRGGEAQTSRGDYVDTSETINGKRERAPAEGVMDSSSRTQSLGRHVAWATTTWPLLQNRK